MPWLLILKRLSSKLLESAAKNESVFVHVIKENKNKVQMISCMCSKVIGQVSTKLAQWKSLAPKLQTLCSSQIEFELSPNYMQKNHLPNDYVSSNISSLTCLHCYMFFLNAICVKQPRPALLLGFIACLGLRTIARLWRPMWKRRFPL